MKLSSLSWAPAGSSVVRTYADVIKTSPSLKAANYETAAAFLGSWGGRAVRAYEDLNETSPSLGAANCETDATFVCFWGAHRRDVLRGSE